jgi:OmpA-OmpF porin, OOP family
VRGVYEGLLPVRIVLEAPPMTARRPFAVLAFAASTLAFASPARSECNAPARLSTCIDVDNLWMKAGPSQFFSIGGGSVTPARGASFGFAASYLKRPLVLRMPSSDPEGTDVYAVDNQLNATLLWAFGLGRGFELTAAMPVTLFQDGVGVAGITEQQPDPLVRSVIRDPRLGVSYAIVPPDPRGTDGLSVVARGEVSLPTGDERVFAGAPGPVGTPSVSAALKIGRIKAGAELGARIRKETELLGVTIGSQTYEAIGVGYAVLDRERLEVNVEAFSLQTLATQRKLARAEGTGALVDGDKRGLHAPTEWLLSVRSAPALGGDVSFHAGGGTALPLSSSAATEPLFRLVAGVRYAPLGRDRDGDGVLDRDDLCPDAAEDRDGFEDQDGCPDPDNDRDGIPDAQDQCRDAPEDRDGVRDEDGCPDLDDDEDGVPDADDQCRAAPEDKDGWKDEDGCPDPDNDADGILDAADVCPNGPEDFDGFRDQDGCPDPDNDGDGILDGQDRCPSEAEDKDGFEDEDGCPEPDNDQDGVPDGQDRCPLQPETIDGIDDEDGCPEPQGKNLASFEKGRVAVTPPLRFAAGDAKITPELLRGLKMAAQRARAVPGMERVIVETYGDAQNGSAREEKLAVRRADAVKAALSSTGLTPDSLTVAVGDLTMKRPPNAPHVDVQVVSGKRK